VESHWKASSVWIWGTKWALSTQGRASRTPSPSPSFSRPQLSLVTQVVRFASPSGRTLEQAPFQTHPTQHSAISGPRDRAGKAQAGSRLSRVPAVNGSYTASHQAANLPVAAHTSTAGSPAGHTAGQGIRQNKVNYNYLNDIKFCHSTQYSPRDCRSCCANPPDHHHTPAPTPT
jgi:hypothetical protein